MQTSSINRGALLKGLLVVYLSLLLLVCFSLSVPPADLPLCVFMFALATLGLVLAYRESRTWRVVWTSALIVALLSGALEVIAGKRIAHFHAVASRDSSETKIPVPAFQIKVVLSDAAAKKLHDAGESIKGNIGFDGDGTPQDNKYHGPSRGVFLGSFQFEMTKAGLISVSNVVISEDAYERLSDTNYYYTINVFSGRRAFKDNILDGGYAEGRINDVSNAPIEITCDLIK